MMLNWQVPEWRPCWGYIVACGILLLAQKYLKLIERLISLVLSLRLVSVLNSLGPGTVQFSLRKGSFSLQNVQLKPEFVDSLDLPLRCKQAIIRKLEFHMPVLRYKGSRAALLQISNIELEGITRRTPKNQKPELFEERQGKADAAQRQAKLSAVEALLWDSRPTVPRKWRLRNFFKRHLAFQVARMLDIQLRDISLHMTVDRGLKFGMELPSTTPGRGSLDADVIGSVVTFRLRSFVVKNAATEGYGVLLTDIQAHGLSIEVAQAPTSSRAGETFSLVRRWNADVKLGWRLASGFFDRVAQRSSTPVVNINIFAHALLFHFNAPALKSVVGLHSHVLYYYRYHNYRMLRPQVSVDENPQAWWRHAGQAVLTERRKTLGSDTSRWGLTHRRYARQQYQLYYLRHRSLLQWLFDVVRGNPNAARDSLMHLESQLGDGEIAQFRWWAWVNSKTRHQGDTDRELPEKLEAVFRVMGARGKLRQKRSRPLRAQLQVGCPKVSVVLETGGSQPTLFEVAMHHLNCTLLAGSQNTRQLQSGAGPISVDASVAALHVSHTAGATTLHSYASTSSCAAEEQDDLLTPTLMRSPPQASKKEIPSNFLTLSCSQPALRAAEPLQVRLEVAQIDMVYSQYALLRLVAFLNESYPPPNLDPLMVRASVTLNEIVRERLVGPKRPHQLQKHQQSQLQIQATAGDIRMMMPCSKRAAAGRAAAFGQASSVVALDESLVTNAEETSKPSFLVVVLSGFSASSQAQEQRLTPRLTRSVTLGRSGRFDRTTSDIESISLSAATARQRVSDSGRSTSHDGGPVNSVEADVVPVPVSAFSSLPEPATNAVRSEREGWMRRRPGATFFEKLQVQVGFEAFLAKQDFGQPEFPECAQVVDPFVITTKVDHCVEPATLSSYRRILQVMMTTSRIRIEVSRFVKQELHSLVNYMHSNLTHQQVTRTITRHFAGKSLEGLENRKSMDSVAMSNQRLGFGSNVTFGDRRSTMKRIATATTELSTQQSADAAATEDGEAEEAQERLAETHYGLVLALQVHIPDMSFDLVQSVSSEGPLDTPEFLPNGLFCIAISDLQTTLAIDEDVRDFRFAIGCFSVDDLAEEAAVRHIIRHTPLIIDEACSSRRSALSSAFQAWRMHVAEHSTAARHARDSMHHMLLTCNSQVSGHVVSSNTELDISVDSSLLHVALEVGTMRRALLYGYELAEAEPEEADMAAGPLTTAVKLQPPPTGAYEGGTKIKADQPVPASSFSSEGAVAPVALAEPRRSLSIQVHMTSMHVDVVMEGSRLATIIASGMEFSWKSSPEAELHQQLTLQCTGFQVLDRLCASHLYREAVVCEKRNGNGGSETAMHLAVVVQNAHRELPEELQEKRGLSEEKAQPSKTACGSPTAVQRLAALGVTPGTPAHHYSSGGKKHLHRRRKKAQPQRVVRVECEGLHVAVVARFFYDCAHFGREVMAMKEAVASSNQIPSCVPTSCYRTITEVVLSDLRVDIPRHSWSPEFYSLSCRQASIVHPATSSYVEQLMPDMSRPPSSKELTRATLETFTECDWWQHVPDLLRSQSGNFATETASADFFGASASSPAFHGADEHNDKFHHWQEGQDAGIAAQWEEPKLFWCLSEPGSHLLAMRQVWDSGDIVANIKPQCMDTQIWCPWVRSVFGELQYELLLAVFWENAFEPCSFAAEAEPVFPYGRPLPPAPPLTKVLGVDKTLPPKWKVNIDVRSVQGAAEKLPPPQYALGCGPDLGRVQMQDLHVMVGEWPCGSWDITVSSRTLLVADTRLQYMGTPLYIVQIGEAEDGIGPVTLARAITRLTSRPATAPGSPSSRWAKIRKAVHGGTGPFALPKRLARNASFAWDTPRTPRSCTFFTKRGQEAARGLGEEHPIEDEEEGFFLEYVMQAAAPPTAETPGLAGPHVVEIVAKGAQLSYPPGAMRSFGHDVVEAYSHYVYPSWVSPYPQDQSPDQWMYVNVITTDCQLFVPLSMASPLANLGSSDALENGFNVTWNKLRLGQFWGGDGECCTRLNANELSASGHVDGSLHGQGLISPFKVKAEMRMHNPKDKQERTSISLDIQSSNFEAQPSFGQMPLFHSAARLLLASAVDIEDKLDKTEEFLRAVVFRPSMQRLNVNVDSLSVGLVDDRYGHHIKVLSARLQDLEVKVGRDYPVEGLPADTHGVAKMALDIVFLNSAVDATEPMVESWPFNISFREANGHHMANLLSDTRLNLIITPSAFRSMGDLVSFVKLASNLPDKPSNSMPNSMARTLGKALTRSRQKLTTLYRITNLSGLKLSYWVESAPGDSHLLRPFQSSDLHVEPAEKSVIMPDSQQHVNARTICMQFEGNWTPVMDIIVDKVGKYAYTIGSPHETSMTPVVMDVSLDIRTKVLTVHSPFRIENHTNHPLEFNVHLFLAPAVRDTMGALLQAGNAAISTVPASPLAPGAQCYLPVPAVWGGLMYLHAVGWQIGKKDKIDLEGPKLKEKEGLYTCPPISPGQKPFHCCLKVQEELIKVISKDGIASSGLPEYVMCFQPPLVVHNVLPYPITVTLADSAYQAEQSMFTIGVGGFVEVYQFDLSRKIRMSIRMEDFHSLHSVNIHYPPNNYMDDATRKSVIADLPGLRLAKHITLIRNPPPPGSLPDRVFGPQTNRLNLRLHNKKDSGSRAREVVVSCPYWIVNKTNLVLKLKDTTLNANQPIAAPPGLGGQADPVLFSTSRGSMRVSVQHGAWSWAINLEGIGLHHAFHVLGPPQAVRRANKATTSADESIMHFDCERVIAPRGYSPRKTRLVGRLGSMSRLDSMESMVELPSPASAEVTDPGHVLRKFNCATGGGVVEGESQVVKRFEFAIETSVGPSIFHRTKVITIIPRYVLFNNSEEPLQYGQRGTTLVWQLSPGVRSPFHWDDAEGKFELCVRPAIGRWNWSGAFQIATVGDIGLRVYNPTTKQHLILPVEVSLNGASFLVTVGKEAEQPPYRIENRCENVKVRFQQRDIDREHWENVDPGHSVDYAWEEPNMPHRLCVSLETDGVAFRDASEHEYNLDVIKAFPVVKLRRTNIRIVHKVANTVGRVMTTGMSMANKSSHALQSQDQPELDARYVYVGVHADGPTRVLCFSETRDEYTRGTNEESVALLTQKLKSLEDRNKDVDAQLRSIDEKQIIDMSLLMGAPTSREGGLLRDQMDIPNRPSMRLGRMRTLSTDLAAVGSMVSISRAPSLPSSSRVDSKTCSPRDDASSITVEECAKAAPPNMVRRSLAMIKKVTLPKEPKGKDGLAAIKERDGEDSKSGTPTRKGLPDGSAHHVSFGAAVGNLETPGPKLAAANANQATHAESQLTSSAFSQRSLTAQKNLSRLGRDVASPWHTEAPEMGSPTTPATPVEVDKGSPSSLTSSSPGEIQPDRDSFGSMLPDESEARKGTILMATNKVRESLHAHHLSLHIPKDTSLDTSQLPPSPYDSIQPSPSGLGMAALTRLKRLSIMRQQTKARTLGSNSELDSLLAINGLTRGSLSLERSVGSPISSDKEQQLDENGDPILGGELLVKVWDAQGLMEAWRKKEEKLHKSASAEGESLKTETRAEQLKRRAMRARGDVYCVLRCEGQVKRTALARGHHNPLWKEDIAFKSVQISSDLQVTVYGRARLGHDVFLGEVVIPLREVESVADVQMPEVRRYILGRRNAKEKVSGEVSLACSWRVTPLDVVTMKVKQQQAEVDHKEEILALLQEKYNLTDAYIAAPAESQAVDSLVGITPTHKSFRVMSDQDPELKRIVSHRGRLCIKVIEGKNISPNHDLLHSFYTIDGYVQVTVNSEAGTTSLATKAERGNVAPVWNKMLTFSDVALGNTFTVSLYDHKKLTADVLLGQATLTALKFRNCKPHYLWLPLKRKNGDNEVSIGELHLRIQWTSDEWERPPEALPTWALDVQLKGIGLSVIEATVLKFPREAMHALFEDIHVDFKFSSLEQSGSFAISSMQLDNQLLTSSHPVVLSHDAPASKAVPDEPELGHKHAKPPFLEIRWDMQQHNSSIIYFKSVSFTLQDMDLVLEEEFLELMVYLVNSLPMSDIWQSHTRQQRAGSGDQEAEILQNLQEVLDASVIRSAAAAKRVGKKWYFENLDIQGINCNLTLIPKTGRSDEAGAQRARLTTAFGIHFMDINNVSLRINALQMKNAFVTWRSLVTQIYRHLFFQALHEVHKILGQVDILGSPIVLGSSIFAGVTSFFKEPLKARNPKQFASGIGKGSLALIKFSAFGFLEAAGQLTGGVSKGLALMTMDQEYVNRFRFRSVTMRQRLLQGVQAAGVGVYEGVLGVLREPINGWVEDGLRGVFVGVYMGGSGLVLKPVSGLLEFFSRSIGGVGEAIRAFGDEVTRVPKTRIRSPRQFMSTGLATGELYNVSWKQSMMARLRKGRFAEDEILDYLQNKDNKAVLFTNRHLIYINLKRQQVRWSFSLDHLTTVSTSGLLVLLHHDLTLKAPLPWPSFVHVPVRKRVKCRTRDLHQSLLVKLNRAQLNQPLSQHAAPATSPKPQPSEASLDLDNLHILNALPPHSSAPPEQSKKPTALMRGLSRMLSARQEGPSTSESPPPITNDASPPNATGHLTVSEEEGAVEEIGPLPERKQQKKHRLNPQLSDGGTDQMLVGVQAIRHLAQAAAREDMAPTVVLQHLSAIALLSRTCAHGVDGVSDEVKATMASIGALCQEVSEKTLKESGRRLMRTLLLLCTTIESALCK